MKVGVSEYVGLAVAVAGGVLVGSSGVTGAWVLSAGSSVGACTGVGVPVGTCTGIGLPIAVGDGVGVTVGTRPNSRRLRYSELGAFVSERARSEWP